MKSVVYIALILASYAVVCVGLAIWPPLRSAWRTRGPKKEPRRLVFGRGLLLTEGPLDQGGDYVYEGNILRVYRRYRQGELVAVVDGRSRAVPPEGWVSVGWPEAPITPSRSYDNAGRVVHTDGVVHPLGREDYNAVRERLLAEVREAGLVQNAAILHAYRESLPPESHEMCEDMTHDAEEEVPAPERFERNEPV